MFKIRHDPRYHHSTGVPRKFIKNKKAAVRYLRKHSEELQNIVSVLELALEEKSYRVTRFGISCPRKLRQLWRN